jgi:hypothetical protein
MTWIFFKLILTLRVVLAETKLETCPIPAPQPGIPLAVATFFGRSPCYDSPLINLN